MANVRLTWELPNVSPRQQPIDRTDIYVRDDPSLPWTLQDGVSAASAQELLFADVPAGTNYYQAIVVDVAGAEGPPAETSIDVPFDVPGSVTNLTATLE